MQSKNGLTNKFTICPMKKANLIEIIVEEDGMAKKVFRSYRTKDGWGVLRENYAKNVRKAARTEPNPDSQQGRILNLLKENVGEWVPLWKIMNLKPRIARYNTRVIELRHMGYDIENRTEIVAGKKRKVTYSEYRLNK